MTALRWEWGLSGGRRVVATLDPAAGTESVSLDGQLVARARRGAKPDGHLLATGGAIGVVVVTFEPTSPICVLRVDGDEVPPVTWPGKSGRRPERPRAEASIAVGRILVALVMVTLLVVGAFGVRAWLASRPTESRFASLRASNGLFVARHPTSFLGQLARAPGDTSVVVLEDRAGDAAIVLLAMPLGDGIKDPWLAHKRLHGEALAALPRSDGAYEESSRHEGTCHGEHGAVVVGRGTTGRAAGAKIWSCAFVRDDAAFLFAYAVREDLSAEGEARVRDVVDATELTRLGDLAPAGPP